MASYNKVILMGNLTRDPEMKYLPSGAAVANFGLAVNESYTDKQTGEKKESACFVDIQAWERQAEIVNEFLLKGDPVFIEGGLKFESWEDQEGKKRSRLFVRIFRMQLLGSKKDRQEAPQQANTQEERVPHNIHSEPPQEVEPQQQAAPTTSTADDDDIPF